MTAPARRGGDRGAVAIVVAISVATLLMGFAALAVDLGQLYLRKGELQSVADLAALAGATELPDVARARETTVAALCPAAGRVPDWGDTVCPGDDPAPDWTRDGNPANGEIIFYARDVAKDGGFDAADEISVGGTAATALRVLLPESTVEFGPAATFGVDQVSLAEASTARIGTPLGMGMLPFAVSTADLTPRKQYRFCVRDPGAKAPPARGSAATADPCSRPEALRGSAQVARDDVPTDPARALAENTRSGIEPTVQRWPLDRELLSLPAGLHCDELNARLGGMVESLEVDDDGLGYVNCADVRTKGFAAAMTAGLVGDDDERGRLQRRCSDQRAKVKGVTLDGTDLFAQRSPLVRRGPGYGSPSMLRGAIRSGAAPVPGWITSAAFQCPRLAAMPVVDTSTFTDGGYPVVDVTYAWIEDDADGLLWRDADTLSAFRGYVIDPGYFPDVVTGSPVVGDYLGDYLPKEAVLVRDLGDPAG